MRTPVKLAAFAGVVAVVFAGALAVGSATGSPIESGSTNTHSDASAAETDGGAPDAAVGGLLVADRGYVLDLADPVLPAAGTASISFRVGAGGAGPVVEFDRRHGNDMHLSLVRRDGAGFQHLHPAMAPDGTWSADAEVTPGAWRAFADFVPATGAAAGERLTLGADLSVGGAYDPQPVRAESRRATVDGYELTLSGGLTPGVDSALTVSVSRSGEPVDVLEPYLGAYGHLVVLRAGDLAYLHVHPEVTPAGPDIAFHATAPSTGTYLLYLNFKHNGQVRTAEFAVVAGSHSDGDRPPEAQTASDDHGDGSHSNDGHSD